MCVLKWKIIESMLFTLLAHAKNIGTWNVFKDIYKIRWYENRVVLVSFVYDINRNQKQNVKII